MDGLRWTVNQTPLISIIVPNYNHARFLEQRLESIFQQTIQDFEVILLDDASTDGSLSILQDYRRKYPQVAHLLVNKSNTGSPFQQWEKGINLARGQYIWIAESDDWAEATFLEKLLPLVQQKGVSLAFCNSHWINEKGKIGKPLSIHNSSFLKDGKAEIIEHLVYHNSIQNVSSVLFKESFLRRRKPNYVNYKVAGDWLLYVDLLLQSKVAFCEEKLNYFRWYYNNVSNQTNRRGLWAKEGIEILGLMGSQIQFRRK
ncbi:MAG: glycosyltransferase, partial [Bacteroidota bacterium]